MPMSRRTVILGSLWSLAIGILAAGVAGCSDVPATGTGAAESPEVQKNRQNSIKEAMRKGSYGAKYKDKNAPAK